MKLIVFFNPDSNTNHYHLLSDSFSYAVEATLHHIVINKIISTGFSLKKLSENQRNSLPFAVNYLEMVHFKPQIEHRHMRLFIDHKALVLTF